MDNSENNFKTPVSLDLSLDIEGNYDVLTKEVVLLWNVEFEMRSYGIKSLIITVPIQPIVVNVSIWMDDGDEEEELQMEIKDVVIERISDTDQLIPRSLEFFKGQWKLVF